MSDLLARGEAVISECGRYRYRLHRQWGSGPIVLFVMLNPSTADADQDDPTIRRCIGFAREWGYGSLFVGNLFAYRATDPRLMFEASDPVGQDNKMHLGAMCQESSRVICAWGTHGVHRRQDQTFMRWLDEWNIMAGCIGITKFGFPKHPLYVPRDAAVQVYGGRV